MNRTKKEIVEWLFDSCNVTGGTYQVVEKGYTKIRLIDKKYTNTVPLAEIDKHTKKGTVTHRIYGIPVNDIDDADVLVIKKKYSYTSADVELNLIKNLLDRVFGSSDSWPDEYCDTLGWRLK
jgi:hypothetical protein